MKQTMNIFVKGALLVLLTTAGLFAAATHSAKVLETLESGGYTYIKVLEGGESYWIAMTQRPLKAGETIRFAEQGWMQDFHSKTLNRTFDKILFASDVAEAGTTQVERKPDVMSSAYQQKGTITIAQLFADRERYSGKKVRVRAKVTKTSAQIMKRNWVHLQDGSRFANADDLVFTSNEKLPEVGSVVTAEGIVAKDKDFGYGYFYSVIVEKASFSAQ
jgi:hypothetical protein